MGIKQRFPSYAYEASEARDLGSIWAELQASGYSTVVVVDASNFLMSVQRHHLWRTDTASLPRANELRKLLQVLLHTIQRHCPEVQFHFILDGVSKDDELACKIAEKQRREASRMLENAVEAKRFSNHGCGPGASFDATPLLINVVTNLDGEHWIGRAHSHTRDLDIAVVLHARRHNSGLLFSDDSDFLILFPGRVVRIQSLEFLPGCLTMKSLSLQERLVRFELESWDQLRMLAFLAGSDFHHSVAKLPWTEMASRARELAQTGSWQDAVRAAGPEVSAHEIEAFIENFDLYAVDLVSSPDAPPSQPEVWACGGEECIGITSLLPAGPLDPILELFAVTDTEGLPTRLELDKSQLLVAYARGQLSAATLNFLRHKRTSALPYHCDLLDGSSGSVFALRHHAYARLTGFLCGPLPDEWDDEPDEVVQFRTAMIAVPDEQARSLCMRSADEVLELESQLPSLTNSLHRQQLRDHLHSLRTQLVESMLEAGGTSKEVVLEAADIPEWVHAGPQRHELKEDESVHRARLRSTFFLATGADLELWPDKELQKACRNSKDLLMKALVTLGKKHVLLEHLRELSKVLGVDDVHCHGCSQTSAARSAMFLGELCRWVPKYLEDMQWLCGGQPLNLKLLPFAGGPLVLTAGRAHKAQSGYSIHLRGPEGVEVGDRARDAAKDYFVHLKGIIGKTFGSGGFKVSNIGPEIWIHHDALMEHDGVMYKLKVKAFD